MANERILLVQLADIGDLVLATPAMAALREAKPDATIDLFASAHALPIVPPDLLNCCIPFEKGPRSSSRAFLSRRNLSTLYSLRQRQYDTIVFFHHFTLKAGVLKFRLIAKASGARRTVGLKNPNIAFLTDSLPDEGFGAKHEAQYWLDLVGLLGASTQARPASVKRETGTVAATEPADRAAPKVVIHAGSGGYSSARRWSPERFADVARRLRSKYGCEIVLVGQAGDDTSAVARMLDFEVMDLVGRTTLPQLAEVIHRANLFVGADSGVMHIAAAAGTPVVSIFGPSNYQAWQPWAPDGQAFVVTSGVECSPCSYVGHSIGAREGCPARTCMKLVTVDQVLEKAISILDSSNVSTSTAPQLHRDRRKRPYPASIRVLGVPVDGVTYAGWIQRIGDWINLANRAHHVCTVNPEFIMIAQRDPIFFQILSRADLCVPDGVGLLWASKFLGQPIPERVTGSDGVPLIARHAAEAGWRIFLLGAAEGVAARAAEKLRQQYAGLQIAGCYAGSPAEGEEDDIVATINSSDVDILLVAYGAPQQDKWIARNLPRLQVKMAMGIGGSLDFIAGYVPRAPLWMRQRGVEWLYRLLRQPWRLRRMLRLPRFVLAVLRQRER